MFEKEFSIWRTICGKCNAEIKLRAKSNTTRDEAIEVFGEHGWELFPSRCPNCKIKPEEK